MAKALIKPLALTESSTHVLSRWSKYKFSYPQLQLLLNDRGGVATSTDGGGEVTEAAAAVAACAYPTGCWPHARRWLTLSWFINEDVLLALINCLGLFIPRPKIFYYQGLNLGKFFDTSGSWIRFGAGYRVFELNLFSSSNTFFPLKLEYYWHQILPPA